MRKYVEGLFVRVVIGCVLLVAVAQLSHAALLNLELQSSPDVTSGFISVNYSAASDELTAVGFASHLNNVVIDPMGTFDIIAMIDDAGNLSGGSISIADGSAVTLIAGTIYAFGYQDGGGELFEFAFTPTEGSLLGDYGTASGGVILNLQSFGFGFTGSFTSDFSNFGTGTADTAPVVPEPATLSLLMVGLIAARKKRRSL